MIKTLTIDILKLEAKTQIKEASQITQIEKRQVDFMSKFEIYLRAKNAIEVYWKAYYGDKALPWSGATLDVSFPNTKKVTIIHIPIEEFLSDMTTFTFPLEALIHPETVVVPMAIEKAEKDRLAEIERTQKYRDTDILYLEEQKAELNRQIAEINEVKAEIEGQLTTLKTNPTPNP